MATNRTSSLAHAINKAKAFVQSTDFESLTFLATKLRLETLEDDWAKYNMLTDDVLDVIGKADLPKLMADIQLVRSDYFVANAAFQEKMAALNPGVYQTCSISQDNRETLMRVSMQYNKYGLQNTWGEFDGIYRNWKTFHDGFKASIHDNEQMPPNLKFYYLKKSLVSRASTVFSEWKFTDEDYYKAWDRLNEEYDKSYLIARDHMRQLIYIPELRKPPTADRLQRMSKTTQHTLKQLKSLGLPVEYWDFFVVHILSDKFDPETARKWELQRDSDQPKVSSILAFIDKEARDLSNASKEKKARASSTESSVSCKKEIGSPVEAQHNRRGIKEKLCEVCFAGHQIWVCPEFIALSYNRRRDFVDSHIICANCLKHGHKDDNCFTRGCVRCPGKPKHNILLCPTKEMNESVLPIQRRIVNGNFDQVNKQVAACKRKLEDAADT